MTEAHVPMRGSDVEAWIKRVRDEYVAGPPDGLNHIGWQALDNLLDDYRDHADTGIPLSEEVHGWPYSGEDR